LKVLEGMSETELKGALAALNGAPGPAPWFATQPPERKNESLRWCAAREDGGSVLEGANLLLDASDAVLLVLPRYGYAQLIKPSYLLCWQSSKDNIVFRLFNTHAFDTPLAESISATRDKVTNRAKMAWASGLVWEEKLLRSSVQERYEYAFPRDLEGLAEVLVLANGEATQLYRLSPTEREVAVYPF
jgi:hypothetical protein